MSKVDQTLWRYAARDLLNHLKEGKLAEGFVRAVKTCGAVLVKHSPVEGKKDQTRPPRFFVLSGSLSGSRPRRNVVSTHGEFGGYGAIGGNGPSGGYGDGGHGGGDGGGHGGGDGGSGNGGGNGGH